MSTCCAIFLALALISQSLAQQCGTVQFTRGLIINGRQVVRGQWPFLVALFDIEKRVCLCGGNLISPKSVLTAAHCVRYKEDSNTRKKESFLILVGRYDLKKTERGGLDIGVSEIHIHPDWDKTDAWDADIAVLILAQSVGYSEYIQPVCLPTSSISEYADGFVAGWGKSESAETEFIPREVKLRAVNDTTCYLETPDLAKIGSQRTYCAGGKGSGACTGDSGSGFFVKINNLWTLKGLVSSSLFTSGGDCDVYSYTIYTNVVKFLDWINQKADLVDKSFTLRCSFVDEFEWALSKTWYSCKTVDVNLLVDNRVVTKLLCANDYCKSRNDVEIFSMHNQKARYLMNKVGETFPNLKKFSVRHCGLKIIKRANFKNMEGLKILDFVDNEIETIPSDALDDLDSLIVLDFKQNRIRALDPDTFYLVKELQQLILSNNLLTVLPEGTFRNNKKLWGLWLNDNNLKTINVRLSEMGSLKKVFASDNNCVDIDYDSSKHSIDILRQMYNNC